MKVYVTSSNPYRRRFHRSRSCRQLVKGPATGLRQKVLEIDATAIGTELPCLVCFSDAPRARSAHRYCYICDPGKVRPCAHNGGVLVPMYRTHQRDGFLHEAGETYLRRQYVWPENATKYLSTNT